MTDKQLEKFGFYPTRKNIKNFLYWHDDLEKEFLIPRKYSFETVLDLITNAYYESGISTGKSMRSTEIRKLLNIEHEQ